MEAHLGTCGCSACGASEGTVLQIGHVSEDDPVGALMHGMHEWGGEQGQCEGCVWGGCIGLYAVHCLGWLSWKML